MTENPFATPGTRQTSELALPRPKRMWFTHWTSLGLTLGISFSFAGLIYLDHSNVDLPKWFPIVAMGYIFTAMFVLLFLTLLQILATMADFATNRMKRACISFFAAIVGASAIAIMISSMN